VRTTRDEILKVASVGSPQPCWRVASVGQRSWVSSPKPSASASASTSALRASSRLMVPMAARVSPLASGGTK